MRTLQRHNNELPEADRIQSLENEWIVEKRMTNAAILHLVHAHKQDVKATAKLWHLTADGPLTM